MIGLFIKEKIPRGLTLQETIAEIKRQGGIVYVPHPFDRMHSVPDYKHLLDVIDDIDVHRDLQPAGRDRRVQRGGRALRRQVPHHRRRGLGRARAAGARVGSDPDARLRRSRAVPRVTARRRHHPQSGEPVLRSGAEVPANQGNAGGRARGQRRSGECGAPPASPDCTWDASPDARRKDKRRARPIRRDASHRRRDPREVPRARHP